MLDFVQQLAYRTMVLSRCPLVPEIMHEGPSTSNAGKSACWCDLKPNQNKKYTAFAD